MTDKSDMQIVFEKLDEIQKCSTKIQVSQATTNEHLKTLNGKVQRNVKEIEGNRQHLYENTTKMNEFEKSFTEQMNGIKIYVKSRFAKYSGAIGMGCFVIGIIVTVWVKS